MHNKQIGQYTELYRDNLLNDVIPFWLENSLDKDYGGYFTCLDRGGRVFDTDKYIWLQCRQVWCFAMLYNTLEKKQAWLDFAIQGADFLIKNGRDSKGDWFFSLTRAGLPLTQPYNIFSDCFAAMAFGQLHQATGEKQYAEIAIETFNHILRRQENPKGRYNKTYEGTRPLQSFALPMILSNLVTEVESLLEPELVKKTIQSATHSVMEVFYQSDSGLILENVDPEGKLVDSFEGRLINPGHGLEAMWFIMDIGVRNSDSALIKKAVDITLSILEYGWDKAFDGIFYFMDIKNCPPQQLEWDQKLWWVHIESMTALLKGYLHTGDERCWDWYLKVHAYTWKHFPDAEYGEWFGYLNRQGDPLLSLKGGKWKGCFHVPRGLLQCWKTLELIRVKHTNNKPAD